jgi:murein DD-endopeptidase MepM/ murein hydrolase activator NlpD
MAESILWLVGSDIAQRAVVNLEQVPVDNFGQWALSIALCGMDRDNLLAAVVDYHGEAAVKAYLNTIEPAVSHWRLPVGEGDFPPSRWYVATIHDLHGTKRQPLGLPRRHSGIDINLDFAERGDVERRLGLSVFSITRGIVTYVTDDWGGVGMVVIRHDTIDGPEWWRYAHLVPSVKRGDIVACGDKLGSFANYKDGDHAHVDGADEPITRQWLTAGVSWFDPVERLKQRIDPAAVDAMLARG